MKLSDLKIKTPAELLELAQSLGIENISRAKKQTLIFAILKHKADNDEEVLGDGVLDILQEGYGFLRSSNDSYVSGPDDIYVSPNQIGVLICQLEMWLLEKSEHLRKVKNILL